MSPSHKTDFQALLRECEAAKKKVDEYVNLVATLSNELDFLHTNICFTCRWRFAPTHASSRLTSNPLLRRFFRPSRRSLTQSPLPNLKIDTSESGKEPAAPSKPTPLDEQTNYVLLPSNQSITSADSAFSPALSPAFSPAATEENAHPDKIPVVYNPQIERCLTLDIAHVFAFDSIVFCASFNPNGRYLAVGLESGKTRIYDVETHSQICVLADWSLKEETGIRNVKFSPNSKYLATGGSDHQIRIWDIAPKRIRAMLKGHTAPISSLIFLPDSRSLISSSYDQSLRIWRTRDGSLQKLINHTSLFFFSLSLSPDGRYVTAANADDSLRIWDVRTGRLVMRWTGHSEDIWSVVFVPDGKGLLSGSKDKTLKYWEVDLDPKRSPSLTDNPDKRERLTFEGHTSCINTLSVAPDSQWVLSGSDDRSVRIWDARNAEWQCTLRGHDDEFVLVADFSPGGGYLVTGGEDSRVVLWKFNRTLT